MSILKGFIEIPTFINNQPGVVSPLGELSSHSRTFSLDKTYHSDPDKDHSRLVVFSNRLNEVTVDVPDEVTSIMLSIMESAFTTYTPSTSFVDQVIGEFPEIEDVTTGPEQTYLGTQIPVWIEFTLDVNGVDVVSKFWLNDETFQLEYDEYTNLVLPPVAILEDLYTPYASAKIALDAFTTPIRFERLRELTNKQPDTHQTVISLRWQDPSDNDFYVQTDWVIVGYGNGGNTRENILKSIREYLEANSTHSVNEWVLYLPEIINISTMTFLPQWDRVALTSALYGDTLYASVFLYDQGMDNLRSVIPDVNLTDLKKLTDIISIPWKSLSIAVVGGLTNSVGKVRFTDAYSDYTALVNDPALNQITGETSSLIVKLERLAMLAEVDTDALPVTLPIDMERVEANGVTFIQTSENNIVMRMATKSSYLAII